jgi:hypothetical protein
MCVENTKPNIVKKSLHFAGFFYNVKKIDLNLLLEASE